MEDRMNGLMETAKIYNVLEAKIKHTPVPISFHGLTQCPDLSTATKAQIRECLKGLVKRGTVSRVPIFGGPDRYGYVFGKTEPVNGPVNAPRPRQQEEVRLRINPDKSITVFTTKFKVTIEVPE
jgi:hypothetical protein